jgi:hypothetical protein
MDEMNAPGIADLQAGTGLPLADRLSPFADEVGDPRKHKRVPPAAAGAMTGSVKPASPSGEAPRPREMNGRGSAGRARDEATVRRKWANREKLST